MAYLGMLAGIETVDQFIAKGCGRAFVELLWDEIGTTFDRSSEINLPAYRAGLLARFRNAALGHRLLQIAMDGSQKLPQRLANPAIELMEAGRSPSAIALVFAAWIRFQAGRSDAGERIEVDDPLAPMTSRLVSEASDAREQVRALLGLEGVFPPRLASDPQFVTLVAGHLDDLRRVGAKAAVESFVEVCT